MSCSINNFLGRDPVSVTAPDALSWENVAERCRPGLNEAEMSSLISLIFTKLYHEVPKGYRVSNASHWEPGLFVESSMVAERFPDILCVKESALQIMGRYLHANRVNLEVDGTSLCRYVAAQAPIVSKRQVHEELFWKAAMEEANVIVDLIAHNDSTPIYYPEEAGEVREILNISVRCDFRNEVGNAIFRAFTATDRSCGDVRQLHHIHYSSWVDKEGISGQQLCDILEICELEREIKKSLASDPRTTMVHCRAGVGRTGTYIAISALLELASRALLSRDNLLHHLKNIIISGRVQRGEYFVQTNGQLKSLLEIGFALADRYVPGCRAVDCFREFSQGELKGYLLSEGSSLSSGYLSAKALAIAREERVESALNSLILLMEPQKEILEEEVVTIKKALERLSQPETIKSLAEEKKKRLYSALVAIKKKAIIAKSWRNGAVGYINDPDVEEPVVRCLFFGKSLENTMNFTMGYIRSHAPQEVVSSPAYYLDLLDVDGEDKQRLVLNKAEALLQKNMAKGKVTYLLRGSSTRSGGVNLQLFTISFRLQNGRVAHCRLAYNSKTGRWQKAEIDKEFDTESSGILYPSVEIYRERQEKLQIELSKNSDKREERLLSQKLRLNERKEVFRPYLEHLLPNLLTIDNGSIINSFASLQAVITFLLVEQSLLFTNRYIAMGDIVPLDCDEELYAEERSSESPLEF